MHLACHSRLKLLYALPLLAAPLACGKAAMDLDKPVQAQAAPDPRVQEYKAHVEPILQSNCLRCHGGMNRRGGFNMSTRASLLQGGKDGTVVVPGRPEDSLLVRVIGPGLAESDPMRMPPKGSRLSAADVATLRKWVADGVAMDR